MDNRNIVLFAPHQDDEILSSCLYLREIKRQGGKVSIIFVTNGDYSGQEGAKVRAKESILALSLLDIEEDDIYFMGYADTGYRLESSFLFKLYMDSSDSINATQYSEKTYHPLGAATVHHLFFGKEASYCRKNFIIDIEEILNYLQPDIIIIPSIYDLHYDHKALGYFFNDILNIRKKTFLVYSFLIHSGNDMIWPDRHNVFFSRPLNISITLWNRRCNYRFKIEDAEWKREIIKIFISQSPEKFDNYLYSFGKVEEFFLLEYS